MLWFSVQVWSNGIYQPTLHRVVNNSPRYRVSVVFFYEVLAISLSLAPQSSCQLASLLIFVKPMVQSNFDAAIEPVEFCQEKTGGAAKYEKVVYGEHLVKKVLTNFVM